MAAAQSTVLAGLAEVPLAAAGAVGVVGGPVQLEEPEVLAAAVAAVPAFELAELEARLAAEAAGRLQLEPPGPLMLADLAAAPLAELVPAHPIRLLTPPSQRALAVPVQTTAILQSLIANLLAVVVAAALLAPS